MENVRCVWCQINWNIRWNFLLERWLQKFLAVCHILLQACRGFVTVHKTKIKWLKQREREGIYENHWFYYHCPESELKQYRTQPRMQMNFAEWLQHSVWAVSIWNYFVMSFRQKHGYMLEMDARNLYAMYVLVYVFSKALDWHIIANNNQDIPFDRYDLFTISGFWYKIDLCYICRTVCGCMCLGVCVRIHSQLLCTHFASALDDDI